ncbi:O-antigen ligase family protein [Parabacteroides sp.]
MNIFSSFFERPGVEKAGILIGFLLVENNIALLPNVGSLYYAIMLAALLYMLLKEQISFGVLTMLGLYATCLLSIWINNVPVFFQPYPRFLTFLMITLLVSPAICNNALTRFRSQVFVTIMWLLRYVIIASFFYGLMGGGYKFVYFQGVTNHSMMLGPFAALCTLFSVYRLLSISQDEQNKRVRIFHALLLLLSLYCLLQAASRTAFFGTLVSVAVFLTVYYRNELGRYLKVIIAVCAVSVFTFPVWNRYMDKLEMKNQGGTELNINSREEHWKQRWNEFQSNPFWGIGFASVNMDTAEGSNFSQEGKVETGSSWLSILSMTGLFGFAAFFSLFLITLKRAWQMWYDTPLLSSFLIAVLCFWTLHMMAEGYVYAGGNSLAFCVWLTLGVIYGVTNNRDLAYELQQKLAE